jgi:hypothetical protein
MIGALENFSNRYECYRFKRFSATGELSEDYWLLLYTQAHEPKSLD